MTAAQTEPLHRDPDDYRPLYWRGWCVKCNPDNSGRYVAHAPGDDEHEGRAFSLDEVKVRRDDVTVFVYPQEWDSLAQNGVEEPEPSVKLELINTVFKDVHCSVVLSPEEVDLLIDFLASTKETISHRW